MQISLRTTLNPATDLGYLLHKNPNRVHEAKMPFGRAILFYPEAHESGCTVTIALDVDPVGMVRGAGASARWDQYVNDRPYVASSFLSSAIVALCSTAIGGRCKERPELASQPIPLEIVVPAIRCRGGEAFLRALFEPLGYSVDSKRIPLDEKFPEWGQGSLYRVELKAELPLKEVLKHLYVLIPVLDDDKHYWVGKDEIDKLLSKGSDWLERHPEREEIARRYLLKQRDLTREALERLSKIDDSVDSDEPSDIPRSEPAVTEKKLTLHGERLDAVVATLKELGSRRVLDLGCGEGKLLKRLLASPQFVSIVGMDVSLLALAKARRNLRLDTISERQLARIRLVQGSLTYRDRSFEGYDAAAIVEVVEHLDPARLQAFERTVFEHARPGAVVMTTPNRDYNELFEGLAPGALRDSDHRFEWTREEFGTWAESVARRHGYSVEIRPIGVGDPDRGTPSQMAVFRR